MSSHVIYPIYGVCFIQFSWSVCNKGFGFIVVTRQASQFLKIDPDRSSTACSNNWLGVMLSSRYILLLTDSACTGFYKTFSTVMCISALYFCWFFYNCVTMPVSHCAWGTCTNDTRKKHEEHMQGVEFFTFPRPVIEKICPLTSKYIQRPES